MINHARTLLLNLRPDPTYRIVGEEFIPAQFTPLTLPSYLDDLHKQLFGQRPDRLMSNYRGRQLLNLLHSTELVEFVTQLDSRITYSQSDVFFSHPFNRLNVVQRSGPVTVVYPYGEYVPPGDISGTVHHSWEVTQIDGLQLRVERLTKPYDSQVQTLSAANGISSPLSLLGTGLGFSFRTNAVSGDSDNGNGVIGTEYSGESNAPDGSANSADSDDDGVIGTEYGDEEMPEDSDPTPQDGESVIGTDPDYNYDGPLTWEASVDLRPTLDLGQIVAGLSQSGEENMLRVFGVGSPLGATEPFLTFRKLWSTHPELPYRLGGLLLAMIYQMERLRTDE